MKKIILRISVLLLTLVIAFSLTSCDIVFEILDAVLSEEGIPGEDPGTGSGTGSGTGIGTGSGTGTGTGTGSGGNTTDKEDQKVEIKPDENQQINPQNPYSSLQSGYNINSNLVDDTIYKVSSYYEADRIIDRAIVNHYSKVTIDFSAMGDEYSLDELKSAGNREMGHTNIKFSYVTSTPQVVAFIIEYDSATASHTLPRTEQSSYHNYKNGNMLIRDYLNGEATRAADFDDFAINKNNNGEMKVYNSEELWWALEHNYLPTFPMENTKAEAFYNEAKNILRQIINDDMTDYEKTLAIFEYLVDKVYYDYDAYNDINSDNTSANTCYYLEGVFEYNRAVCDGKSKAFVLLCRIEGIECVRDWGSGVDGGVGHAWNYVKIGGTWYMVDTTAGDGGMTLTSNGSKVKVEVVNYDYFLCPVNTYKVGTNYDDSKYHYSGAWDELLKHNNNNASICNEYLSYDVDSNGNDFVIDTYEELDLLVDSMFEVGRSENYTLKYSLTATIDSIWDVTDAAIDEYINVEYSVYNMTEYYLVIFTVTP